MIGRVKWFNTSRGFGFIETEDGREVFVHYTEIQGDGFKTLNEDQKVEFDLYDTTQGLTAKGVKKL